MVIRELVLKKFGSFCQRPAFVLLKVPFFPSDMGEESFHCGIIPKFPAIKVPGVPVYQNASEIEYYCRYFHV
jgi:hypothetical protein